ncbi:912_t:CDS:2 [Paraglomus occultum]|uniref:912_t:CDS:1 n=1 Tax=Paraglomus occultum TaxID=144539 RepID=A0A9N9CK74_9GLOM|nr:912_t:CDS:2 [Paraglomus occultum]
MITNNHTEHTQKDSYYSSIFDDYARTNSPPNDGSRLTVNSAWTHTQTAARRRPSLNVTRTRDTDYSIRRQPSYDFPSSSSSSHIFHNPAHKPSPLSSSFTKGQRAHSQEPPSPEYVLSQYYEGREDKDQNPKISSANDYSDIRGLCDKVERRHSEDDNVNNLAIPSYGRLSRSRNRSPSPSGSSIAETRCSSLSSFDGDDVLQSPNSIAPSYLSRTLERTPSSTSMTNNVSNFNYGFVNGAGRNSDRDQYGFKKSYQWISREKYAEFEAVYSRIQARRKIKWDTLLAENSGLFPSRNSKIKRYIRKGVPPSLRGQVWFHYSGAETKMKVHPGLYDMLVMKSLDPKTQNEYAEIIERDLHRTFPENIKFKATTDVTDDPSSTLATENVPMIQSLRRVLVAFSLYSPNIGYCQSLNYIAGLLLLFMEEEKAFWTLVTMIHDYLPENMYDVTMEGSNVDQAVLMMFIMEKMPHIWNKLSGGFGWDMEKLDGNMPIITLVTSHWFLTLYIHILPIETMLRVWDCFFYEGNKVLFRVALAIFKSNENKILAVEDAMEVFQTVQNIPKGIIDCHKLMGICFRRRKVGCDITRKEIERRRNFFRERRKKRVETMLYRK